MTIPDWLGSLATLALGAGIYLYGYRNGVASERAHPVIGRVLREYAEAEAAIRARDAEAPTTKREIPGEEPAISRKENAS